MVFCSFVFSVHFALAQTDQLISKLQAANTSVEQAFNAVLSAEKAGASVTSLLNQLNVAEDLLAQADNAYRTGDSSLAAAKADAVIPIAQQVTSSALTAKDSASASAQTSFWSTIALAVVGSVVLVLALFLVWRRLKRNYIKNLSEAKPELVNNEAQ